MQIKLYIIIALSIIASDLTIAQDLRLIVTVNYEDQSLESILNDMERDLGLKFSFIPSAIPLDSTITLKLTNQSLKTVLDVLSEQVGLEYTVVKDHIAFFHSIPPLVDNEEPFETNAKPPADLEASITELEDSLAENEEMIIDTVLQEIEYAHLAGISYQQQMKPQNSLFITVHDVSKESLSQELPRKKLFYMGPVVSADLYRLTGDAEENEGFSYKTGVNYSVGLSAKFKIKSRWTILLQVIYSTKNFDLHYNFQTVDQDDPFVPEKTIYQQAYLDVPLLLSYRVFEKDDWEIRCEAGVVPGFLLNDEIRTYHQDGSEMETPEFITMKIRSQLYGAQLGVAAEHKVSKKLSLTLTSGWRQYFNGINKEDLSTKLGLFRCAAGVQYAF